MTEQEALARMIAPGQVRPNKPYLGGVIQIHVTRACDKACFGCTQGSNLAGKPTFITPEQFEQACLSLTGYFGVVGVFGGCPTLHPQFDVLCEIMRRHVPFERRGLWANHPHGWGKVSRETFNPRCSNLNVHLDRAAFAEFKRDWPESLPFGLDKDSRHSPPFVAMKDVLKKECDWCGGSGKGITWADEGDACQGCSGTGKVYDEARAWELISSCDINQHWSAMIGVFRGELRAWFCEIAGAQAMLHQDEPDYPDTGIQIHENGLSYYIGIGKSLSYWWQFPMAWFADQVRKHCHDCGVPLRGYGELAQSSDKTGTEQTSQTHANVYRPKRPGRAVQVVDRLEQLGMGRLERMTDYMGNAKR